MMLASTYALEQAPALKLAAQSVPNDVPKLYCCAT